MFYEKERNTIWGRLTVKDIKTDEAVVIKTNISFEKDISVIIENLLGNMNYYRDIRPEDCVSEMEIYCYVADGNYLEAEIKRTNMNLLSEINCGIIFNFKENLYCSEE
ncbi:MAG: hypothetical protein LUG24_10130 [Clostridiales bacterium]|nr:hypothetical protein [Clostridiales bacterium]